MMKLQLTRGILLPIGVLLPVRAANLGHSVLANANYVDHNSIWRSRNEVRTGALSGLVEVAALHNFFLVGHLPPLSAKSAFAQSARRAESVCFIGAFQARELATPRLKKSVEGGTLGF